MLRLFELRFALSSFESNIETKAYELKNAHYDGHYKVQCHDFLILEEFVAHDLLLIVLDPVHGVD